MSKLDEVLLKRNQSWRDDLSQGARDTMELLGSFHPTNTIKYRMVKGYLLDGDGGRCVSYFRSEELREAASHLIEVANWLDAQAVMYEPEEDTFE